LAALRRRVAELKSRLDRSIVLWIEQARAGLGIRRGVHHGNAYYKELSAQRLARALSPPPRGRGAKDYRVTFRDGSKQFIRCTRERCYADLMGPEHLFRLERVLGGNGVLRPGSRVLEIATPPMLTGYTAAWLARTTGESGAVVSLIGDEEGARFAAMRYAAVNLSIERMAGALGDALAGETDGAFDGIVHLDLPMEPEPRSRVTRELWRVLRPGGWMLVGLRIGPGATDEVMREIVAGMAKMGAEIDPAALRPGMVLDVLLGKRAE
jgi:SAM-dependent methyltransferase